MLQSLMKLFKVANPNSAWPAYPAPHILLQEIHNKGFCLCSPLRAFAPGCPAHLVQGGPWGKFPVLNGSIESISFVLGPQPPLCVVRVELVL